MSDDTREDILSRLQVLLGEVSGIATAYRDRGQIPDDLVLPAVILYDGRETLFSEIPDLKTVYMPPAIMTLSVELHLVLTPRDTLQNETLNGVIAPIGPELSSFRMRILNAVIDDHGLFAILGGRGGTGQIIYKGHETDMRIGAAMWGQMGMFFDFRYVLAFSPPH
jgi:hypothetical protein